MTISASDAVPRAGETWKFDAAGDSVSEWLIRAAWIDESRVHLAMDLVKSDRSGGTTMYSNDSPYIGFTSTRQCWSQVSPGLICANCDIPLCELDYLCSDCRNSHMSTV